jgi:uncharacterized tellurite resistance protein B-like protein
VSRQRWIRRHECVILLAASHGDGNPFRPGDLMSRLLRFLGLTDDTTPRRAAQDPIDQIASQLDALPEDRARFFAAFAYVLARVAGADLSVEASEAAAMRGILVRVAGIPESDARLVVEIASAHMEALGGTQNYIVTREFKALATRAERIALLECLYAIAAADDLITGDESNEIRNIALECGLTHDEVLHTRARFKDKLAEFRRLDGER